MTKTTPNVPPASSTRSWDRPLVLSLILLLVVLALGYTTVSIRSAQDMRIQLSLERNLTTARLAAEILDAGTRAALSVSRALAERPAPADALLADDRQALHDYLSREVELTDELLFAAVYTPDGRLAAAYPRRMIPRSNVADEGWARALAAEAPYVTDIVRLPDDDHNRVIALAMPITDRANRVGYLLTYYRLRTAEWLSQVRLGHDGVMYVVSPERSVVAASLESGASPPVFEGHPTVDRALSGEDGAMRVSLPGGDDALEGYAYAPVPGWAILVVQPAQSILGPTNYLLERLSVFVVPFILLMLAVGWALTALYDRQQKVSALLAEHNTLLRSADRAKSDFLANVSHDLKTPLAAVQATLSGLLEPDVSFRPEEIRSCLRLANEEVVKATARVRNLLEMSRIEARAYHVLLQPDDLTDIVASALDSVRSLLSDRRVETEFPREPMMVECDRRQIETVVVNLVENALKYSSPEKPIEIRGCLEDGSAAVYVRDHGPGVPPGDEERVFEKFYRAPADRAQRGTGLGLAICKAIVAEHGGTITVHNIPRNGAEFRFSLPAYVLNEEAYP